MAGGHVLAWRQLQASELQTSELCSMDVELGLRIYTYITRTGNICTRRWRQLSDFESESTEPHGEDETALMIWQHLLKQMGTKRSGKNTTQE